MLDVSLPNHELFTLWCADTLTVVEMFTQPTRGSPPHKGTGIAPTTSHCRMIIETLCFLSLSSSRVNDFRLYLICATISLELGPV